MWRFFLAIAIVRGTFVPLGSCRSLEEDALGSLEVDAMTVSAAVINNPPVSVCLIKLDMRVAYFDNQLEWLQASMLESKCRDSGWLILVVSHANEFKGNLIVDVIQNHAKVDLLIVDAHISAVTKIPQISNGLLEFSDTQLKLFSSCTAGETSSANTLSNQRESRSAFHERKIFSKTSTWNLVSALVLAWLSGIVVNVAIRKGSSHYQFVSSEFGQEEI